MLNVLYEDEQVIVVWKPVGVEAQSSRGFGADMVSEIKKHVCRLSTKSSTKQSPKSKEPYVGVIHRLDKPVSGVMVYAKTKDAAASLSKQVACGEMHKKYLAVLCGNVVDNVDNFVDYLLKDEKTNTSKIVDKGISGAKRAELKYRVLDRAEVEDYGELALAEITLLTGRHHQIRVQMAGHGMPLWGDSKYNPQFAALTGGGSSGGVRYRGPRIDVALAAYQMSFRHPVSGKWLTFQKMPEGRIYRYFRAKMEEV